MNMIKQWARIIAESTGDFNNFNKLDEYTKYNRKQHRNYTKDDPFGFLTISNKFSQIVNTCIDRGYSEILHGQSDDELSKFSHADFGVNVTTAQKLVSRFPKMRRFEFPSNAKYILFSCKQDTLTPKEMIEMINNLCGDEINSKLEKDEIPNLDESHVRYLGAYYVNKEELYDLYVLRYGNYPDLKNYQKTLIGNRMRLQRAALAIRRLYPDCCINSVYGNKDQLISQYFKSPKGQILMNGLDDDKSYIIITSLEGTIKPEKRAKVAMEIDNDADILEEKEVTEDDIMTLGKISGRRNDKSGQPKPPVVLDVYAVQASEPHNIDNKIDEDCKDEMLDENENMFIGITIPHPFGKLVNGTLAPQFGSLMSGNKDEELIKFRNADFAVNVTAPALLIKAYPEMRQLNLSPYAMYIFFACKKGTLTPQEIVDFMNDKCGSEIKSNLEPNQIPQIKEENIQYAGSYNMKDSQDKYDIFLLRYGDYGSPIKTKEKEVKKAFDVIKDQFSMQGIGVLYGTKESLKDKYFKSQKGREIIDKLDDDKTYLIITALSGRLNPSKRVKIAMAIDNMAGIFNNNEVTEDDIKEIGVITGRHKNDEEHRTFKLDVFAVETTTPSDDVVPNVEDLPDAE